MQEQGAPSESRFGFRQLVWIVVFALVCGAFQWSLPGPLDPDTAYHFAVARLITEHGILHSFPWTTFSWLGENYGDKEFLFHLLFIPLSSLELEAASAIIGALLGTLMLSTIYLVLKKERVAFAGLWTLVPMATVAFLYRAAMVRPHLLSITLAVALCYAIARRNTFLTLAASLLYPLSYVAFWQIAVLVVLSVLTALVAARARPPRGQFALCAAGVAVGILVHPNTVNLLRFNWVAMKVLLGAWNNSAVPNIGTEFQPLSFLGWTANYALTSALSLGAANVSLRVRRQDAGPLVFSAAALAFGVLTCFSIRFMEYFAPFTAIAVALASRHIRFRYLSQVVLASSAVYSAFFMDAHLKNLYKPKSWIDPGVAEVLRAHVPLGAQIFNCEWELTGYLLLALPERRFMVALEPTLFYLKDPPRYQAWLALPRARNPDSAEIVRRAFNARFVICQQGHAHAPFLDAVLSDPRTRLLYLSKKLVLIDLGSS
jgi:hypothetical protein